jgi:hypothetical protein
MRKLLSGILPRAGLEHLRQPSMAGVMEAAVGSWGKAFIGVGVIVSVLGAYRFSTAELIISPSPSPWPAPSPGSPAWPQASSPSKEER